MNQTSPGLTKGFKSAKTAIAALCIPALMLAGCDKIGSLSAPAAAPVIATTPAVETPAPSIVAQPVSAPAAPVYMPPGAEQLYQMVAPIALYPDKLIAQVLAGSTYPDQVTAADAWIVQNGGLKAGPLADAAERQSWDPSIKSLTAFRRVLDQMAKNLPWTTALGQAYYNDPDDVMNAIQVMRQRASRAGQLRSTPKLRVATASAPANYTPDPNAPVYYAGPAVIEPPPQYITIEPAQPDVVYVPSYDPEVIYGEPVAAYPGYAYAPPVYVEQRDPRYSNGQIAAAGAVTFGLGVVVGSALERHGWGWNSWGMNWGRPDAYRDGNRPQGVRGFDRPAVVYNQSTYIPRAEFAGGGNARGPQQIQLQLQQAQQAQAIAQQQQVQQAQQNQQRAQQQLQIQQAQQAQQVQAQQARGQQQQQAMQAQAQAQQQAQLRQQEQARRQQTQQAQVNQQQAQQVQQQQAQRAQQDQARREQVQQQAAQQQQQEQARRQQQQGQQAQQQQQAAQEQSRRQQEQGQRAQQVQTQQAQQAQAQQSQARQQQEQQEQARRQQAQVNQQQAQAQQAQQAHARQQQAQAQQTQAQAQERQQQAQAQQAQQAQAHAQQQQQAQAQIRQQQAQAQQAQQAQAHAQQQQAQMQMQMQQQAQQQQQQAQQQQAQQQAQAQQQRRAQEQQVRAAGRPPGGRPDDPNR